MGYYDKFLVHEGMNSTSNEKGTDGKNNNTSAYNHDYYMKNKEKWQGKKTSKSAGNDAVKELSNMSGMEEESCEELLKLAKSKGYDSPEYKELLETLSEGDSDQAKRMEAVVKKNVGSSGEEEFDVDAAAKDVISGKYGNGEERKKALGSDYDKVQKRVNELIKHYEREDDEDVLQHHGIRGMKWGVRRFQTESGALTALGRKRYDDHVTVHAPGKRVPFVSGGNKFQTHREYVTANKFAKDSYKKRKEKIKEEKKNSDEGFVKKNVNAAVKNYDNRKQLQYELNKNRLNAGDAEFKRNVATSAASAAAKSAVIVGAGVLGGMLTANYKNNRMRKEGAGQLPMHGLDSHYEYKIGYDKVAKYMGKAIAFGAISGVTASAAQTYNAQQAIKRADKINPNRARRYNADLKKWQEGEV